MIGSNVVPDWKNEVSIGWKNKVSFNVLPGPYVERKQLLDVEYYP